jgi:hypothetical protein
MLPNTGCSRRRLAKTCAAARLMPDQDAINAAVATIGDALPELYCFVSTTRPLNVAS